MLRSIPKLLSILMVSATACLVACGADERLDDRGDLATFDGGQANAGQSAEGTGGITSPPASGNQGGSSGSANPPTTTTDSGTGIPPGSGFASGGSEPPPPGNGGAGGSVPPPVAGGDSGGTGGESQPPPPASDQPDGDPSRPMVEIPGVPCGVPNIGWMGMPPTVQITGRDVVLAYPCAHEGANVTFFLFLHGTVPGDAAMKVVFTMNAFRIHELVDSHNIIIATPTSVAPTNQWGNEDNGEDLPHLYDVVDWIYDTFGSKFNIKSMWTQGGSWGAFYLGFTFACDPRFEGRLKGVQMIVGGGCPLCSGRLSCQVGQQELEKGGGSPVSDDQKEALSSGASIDPYATQHGCDPKTGPEMVGEVTRWSWPNCDPGWVHSYYLAPGNHADAWDQAAVLKMTEEIKSTEQ